MFNLLRRIFLKFSDFPDSRIISLKFAVFIKYSQNFSEIRRNFLKCADLSEYFSFSCFLKLIVFLSEVTRIFQKLADLTEGCIIFLMFTEFFEASQKFAELSTEFSKSWQKFPLLGWLSRCSIIFHNSALLSRRAKNYPDNCRLPWRSQDFWSSQKFLEVRKIILKYADFAGSRRCLLLKFAEFSWSLKTCPDLANVIRST